MPMLRSPPRDGGAAASSFASAPRILSSSMPGGASFGACVSRRSSTGATRSSAPTMARVSTPRPSTGGWAHSGSSPSSTDQRGLFGRGLRDVWLAQGGGRIQGVRAGRAVETWFFPAAGDEPYVYAHVLDGPATPAVRRDLGIDRDGTRVTVPLAERRLPPNARLRTLVADLVQLAADPRGSRARAASWSSRMSRSQLIAPLPARARPRAASPLRRRGPGSTRHQRADRRSTSRAADPAQPFTRHAPRRARRPLGTGGARDDARRARGPPRRPAPVRRGLAARRSSGCSGRRSTRRGRRSSSRVDRSGLNETHPLVRQLYAKRSSGCCARSSRPRSGGPARVSSAPGRRPRPATRSG